ncbi:MAG: hypothetical protein IPK54_14145 [Dokdonella sp.]|uniref:hypothetical protein n=1 Tax=Dokdonella sp. TaxID=2291710 RepID=UPI0025BB0770|nr:hypothetical protein [Dokdonella sp.]MBK8124676.1 hypothetical protein [Dokdonella sp.]
MGRQRKYLESTTQAALLLCCVGLLSACGSGDLERDEAATMIEEKIGELAANAVPVDKGAIESWGRRLEFTYSANGMLSGNYILDSVRPEVVRFDDSTLMVGLKAPVRYKIVATGISAPSPESNERIVEYSVTQENVPVIVRLLSRKDWRGKVKFAKYDDGWRLGEGLGATFGGPVLESELTPAERAEIDSMILAVDQRRAAQQREREEVAKAAEAARRAFDARMRAARTITAEAKRVQTDFFEDFDSASLGSSYGIRYVNTPTGQGAAFDRSSESRIEYSFARGFPTQGTLEWRILVNHGYRYADGMLTDFNPDALVFTTVGPDTWYPGGSWLTLSHDGTVSFGMVDSIGGQTNLTAKDTPFRFGEWHTVGISFGSQGRSINVDGRVVAHDMITEPLGAGGTPDGPADEPTMGEMASHYWPNNKHDGGFDGVVDTFQASSKQADWKLPK